MKAALQLMPTLVFRQFLLRGSGLPQRHGDRPGQAVPACPGQEVADGVPLGSAAGEPGVDLRLADIGQAGAALVDPGKEVHGDADLLPGP